MIRLLPILLFVTGSYTCGAEEECASNGNKEMKPSSEIGNKQEEKIEDGLDHEVDEHEYDEYYDEDYYAYDNLEELEDELEHELDIDKHWADFTNDDFWYYLGCDEIFKQPLPIHNQSTWMLLRGVYHGILGNERSSISPVSHEYGIHVPFEARRVPGKGRGVFVTENVKKGELVWNSRQTAIFAEGADYREFLVSISPALACDVTQWAYIQDLNVGYNGELLDQLWEEDAEEDLVISVDLDEGILMNDITDQTEVEQNVGCVPDAAEYTLGGCFKNLFALRDISAGEELLCSYSDFVFGSGWGQFGL